jgi:hypothetical protein
MILRTQKGILYQKERKMRGGSSGAAFVSAPVFICAVFIFSILCCGMQKENDGQDKCVNKNLDEERHIVINMQETTARSVSEPAASGSFYPADSGKLRRTVRQLLQEAPAKRFG